MKRIDNTNDNSNAGDGDERIGFEPQDFIDFIGYIAQGNLVALLRITAVCEVLKERIKGLPEDSDEREFLERIISGLALPGKILCKQGKDLSGHEDRVLATCAENNHPIISRQEAYFPAVVEDHAKVGRKWLEVESTIKETKDGEPDTDSDKHNPFGGDDKPGPDKGRFN